MQTYQLFLDHIKSDTFHLLTLKNYLWMKKIKYIIQYVPASELQHLAGNKVVEDMFVLVSPGGQVYTTFVEFLDHTRYDQSVQ